MRCRPFLLALALALVSLLPACSIGGLLAAVTPSGGSERRADFSYGTDPRMKFDAYVPAPEPGRASRPLIVFFYGGSWRSGERELYRFVGQALADRGYPTVVADYRLYPQVRFPDFLVDSARAVSEAARLAKRFGADPQRLVLAGHSAGAYNAAMLALDPQWLTDQGIERQRVRGFIGLAGPYDFLPIINPDVKPVFHHPDYPPGTQPLALADARSPPSFLGAAVGDKLVNPQRNTVQLADKLRSLGVPVQMHLYKRTGHMTLIGALSGPLRWLAPVLDDITAFIETLEPATPSATE